MAIFGCPRPLSVPPVEEVASLTEDSQTMGGQPLTDEDSAAEEADF